MLVGEKIEIGLLYPPSDFCTLSSVVVETRVLRLLESPADTGLTDGPTAQVI